MSTEIQTATTKDWLGDGMIQSYPIPMEDGDLSSEDVADSIDRPQRIESETSGELPETDLQ